MSFILRVDDFPGTKPEEFWKHNLDNFKRFDSVLEKNGVQEYILGVIPKHTTEEHIDWLASNPRIEVALHGIEHDERFPNEFRDYETHAQVLNKIVSAKEPLRRCNGSGEITYYIPPHNVIDLRTVGRLQLAGFKNIMCGPGTEELPMRYAREIGMNVFYSQHPQFYGRTDEMMDRDDAVTAILAAANPIVTLHWTWEWNIGLDSLNRFMSKIGPLVQG